MNNPYSALQLENQLCFPIYLCAKEITRKYDKLLKPYGLTYTQYIVMMYFWENKKSNVKSLGNRLMLDSSTLTPLLKKLEQKGYIVRKKSKKDERYLMVELTFKGEELKENILEIPMQMGKCINLEEKEAIELYRLTSKILNNIEKEVK